MGKGTLEDFALRGQAAQKAVDELTATQGPLPAGWPRIWVEAGCDNCGAILFAELYRPALVDRWYYVTTFWGQVLVDHRRVCKGEGPPA